MAARRRADPFPGAATTGMEQWFDANLRHQIGLLRVSGGIGRQVRELLDAVELDLRRAVEDQLRAGAGFGSTRGVRRLERLLAEVRSIRGDSWVDVRKLWLREMRAIVVSEPQFTQAMLQTTMPVQVLSKLPAAEQLRAIVSSVPFEGRTMAEWGRQIQRADLTRINGQIRIGLVQGEDPRQISRRIVGTAALRGRNGVTQITRNQAETLTRTAANHYSNQARRMFFEENADLVAEELYVATLDGATTSVCRSLDGDLFPLGDGPIPPLHMRCRSLRTAVLDSDVLGERPMKPVTERMLLREFTAAEGLGRVAARAKLPRGTKGAFDAFARRRTRELVGRVPAKTTYAQFLRRQSAEFQNEVLGSARGRLFRSGGLTLKQFVNRAGDEIPLSDLGAMHARAFRAAGLDPGEFSRAA